MADQKETVKRMGETPLTAAERAGRPSRITLALRLVFLPVLALAGGLFLRGGLFRGVEGLKEAVNGAALSFVTEARRYEKFYGAPEALEEKTGKI